MPESATPPETLVGLIGAGIQRSASPRMHMHEAHALGLRLRYELLDLDRIVGGAAALPRVLDECEARGFAGVNVTFPCKQQVIPLLHALSPEAAALNAVNTVVFENGRRVGYNTDASGFAESFRRGMVGCRLDRVVLVGAGGAGAAVGYAALELGVQRLDVHDKDVQRAEALAARLGGAWKNARVRTTYDLREALRDADGVIHATPTGMAKLPGLPLPGELVQPPLWIAEVVYVPLVTELVRLSKARGCRTLDGGGMAVFQAARAFQLFTTVVPDAERMLNAFDAELRLAAIG